MPSVDVAWALQVLQQIDRHGRRARRAAEPALDDAVHQLCLQWGNGAVMDAAARLWFRDDPKGALTIGPTALALRQLFDGTQGPEREKNA